MNDSPFPGFDRTIALARVGGDEDLLRELIGDYLRESPGWRDDLRRAAAGGDAAGLRRAAHTIKGAVGYFGADAAAATADRIQILGRAGDAAAAAADLPELEHQLDRLAAALRAFVPERPSSSENLS